jgi:uncharacterized membrane protein YfcA
LFLLLAILFIVGLFSGILTGLLSVGGGFILIACLLVIPPLFQIQLSMHSIAGFSIIQAFFATISGAFYYLKSKLIDRSIIIYLGFPAMFGGALGSFLAQFLSNSVLKVVFAIMATIASFMMFFPAKNLDNDDYVPTISKTLAIIIGFSTGVLGGFIGLAAGFIFVPVILHVFKSSLRKAIGSSLVTCFLLALGGSVVKIGMQSVSLQMALFLISGGILGAQLGGRANKFVKTSMLKKMVALIIGIIAIKIFYDIFQN